MVLIFGLLQPYLHEEDVVHPGRGQDLLHLFGVHGQRLLTQHILLGIHEQQTRAQVVGVDNSHIHHIYTHRNAQSRECDVGGHGN